MVFNSMLEHLRHGEFDVDPALIGFEGTIRNGKTYAFSQTELRKSGPCGAV
jgi:hypothetical protein